MGEKLAPSNKKLEDELENKMFSHYMGEVIKTLRLRNNKWLVIYTNYGNQRPSWSTTLTSTMARGVIVAVLL